MNSNIISDKTVRPLTPEYEHDSHLKFSNTVISTRQGLKLNVCDMLQHVADHKINDGDMLTLTEKKRVRPDLTLDIPETDNVYPYTFTTYFIYSSATTKLSLYTSKDPVGAYPTLNNPQHLQIEESTDDTQTTRQYAVTSSTVFDPLVDYATIPNNRLFEVELIDESHCRIMHDDGYVKTFLTYDDTTSTESSCSFSIEDTSVINPEHSQVFMYNTDNNYGYMGLGKRLPDDKISYILHVGTVGANGIIVSGGTLSGSGETAELINQLSWPRKSVAKITTGARLNPVTSLKNSIDTSWYNYKAWQDSRDRNTNRYNLTQADANTFRYFDYNEVEPDENLTRHYNGNNALFYANSYTNLENNFLIDCQYTNITGDKMSINITPLKNQLTPQGELAENSPHATGDNGDFCITPNGPKSTDFRTYHKIFPGTNQNRGDDQLCLGYTAYTDQIKFKGDKVSYFHLPNVMKPFTWMNVNYRRVPDEYPLSYPNSMRIPVAADNTTGYDYEDFVGLLRAGAIAGSSPLNSDKIFKKRADYRYFSNWGDAGMNGNRGKEGDSHYGTWLCAWLRMTPDEESERKFGPVWMDRYYDDSRFSEHQVMGKPHNCVEGGATGLLGRLKSKMKAAGYVDIPSELRLERGVLYAYHHIGTNNTRSIIKSFDKHMFHHDIDNYTMVLSGDESPGVVRDDNGYNHYSFDGSHYGKTKAPEPSHGDFRISMWMHSDDWTKTFGHQVLGNYTNDGIAIENDSVITPMLVINNDGNVTMMNTHGEHVTTIYSSQYTNSVADTSAEIHAARSKPMGNLTVLASVSSYMLINNFTMNGQLAETFHVSGGMMPTKGKIIDTHAVDDYMFTVFDNTSAAGRINTQTGEFIDLDVTDFELIQVLSAGDIGQGKYSQFFSLDAEMEPINGKPVYVGVDVDATYYMFSSGAEQDKWIFTIDDSFLNGAEPNIDMIGHGVVPTIFESVSGGVSLSGGGTEVYYNDFKPPVTYLSPENTPMVYSKIYYQNDKSLFMIDGEHVCGSPRAAVGGTNMLYYTKNNNVYAHDMNRVFTTTYNNMSPVITGPYIDNIDNIKVDKNNHIWLFYNNDCVAKFDSEYNSLFNVCVSDHVKTDSARTLSGEKMFDLISQYGEHAVNEHHGVVFHKEQSSELMDVINISTDGDITFGNTVTANNITTSLMTEQTDMSNFDTINKMYHTNSNSLTFKFRTKNKYDQTDFVDVSETFDVSNLARGWHHLSFGFDANLKGIAYFYIDGLLAREVSIIRTSELGKYGFTDVLGKFTTVGATQGYNNELLNRLLKQPGYYHAKNFSIKSLRMYNFNLFRDYIKTLGREHLGDHEMVWNVPSGRRAHLDHVEKFHKHRLPGHKSADFSIDMINTGLSGEAQQLIQHQLEQTINNFKPVITNTTDIDWYEQPDTSSNE